MTISFQVRLRTQMALWSKREHSEISAEAAKRFFSLLVSLLYSLDFLLWPSLPLNNAFSMEVRLQYSTVPTNL